jgi:peptidoglycan/LPS O-acetylase OafA/YrhL
MILSKAYQNRIIYLVVAVLLMALNMVADHAFVAQAAQQAAGVVRQYHLFLSFVLGNIFFLWRHSIPRHWLLFIASAVVSFTTLRLPGLTNVALLTLTYCILYAGTAPMPRLPLISRGDYSYGVYLYGYPVQQVVTSLFPAWRVWWFNLVVSLPVAMFIATLSWHLIEKPMLSFKDRLKPLRRLEGGWFESYPLRLLLAVCLSGYGVILLHWSNLDAGWPRVRSSLADAAAVKITVPPTSG